MPILAKEPDIFPDDLLDSEPVDEVATRDWWVVYTLSRREKDFMRRLRQMEVAHYGPMIKKRNRSPGGRVRHSYVPLFPGYVFLQADEEHRQLAMTTNCISRCLPVVEVGRLQRDLHQIRQLIEVGAPLTPESRLEPGMPVRIKSGHMAGIEGYVIKRHGQQRLVVAVQFLQQGASLLLEDFQVEAI